MNRETKKYLFDILTACDEISSFIRGKRRDDYLGEPLLRRAVERDLEIIGEAMHHLRNIDPSTAQRVPDALRMIGMRHRLIHAYAEVNDDIVWDTAHSDVPKLRNVVKLLLDQTPTETGQGQNDDYQPTPQNDHRNGERANQA